MGLVAVSFPVQRLDHEACFEKGVVEGSSPTTELYCDSKRNMRLFLTGSGDLTGSAWAGRLRAYGPRADSKGAQEPKGGKLPAGVVA